MVTHVNTIDTLYRMSSMPLALIENASAIDFTEYPVIMTMVDYSKMLHVPLDMISMRDRQGVP